MAIVRKSNDEVSSGKGRVNRAKLDATSEADIQRHIREDDGDEATSGLGQIAVAPQYVRRLRERLGLTRLQFASRFGLSERTVEEWELGRQRPTGAAQTLLRLIEREPEMVARILRAS